MSRCICITWLQGQRAGARPSPWHAREYRSVTRMTLWSNQIFGVAVKSAVANSRVLKGHVLFEERQGQFSDR